MKPMIPRQRRLSSVTQEIVQLESNILTDLNGKVENLAMGLTLSHIEARQSLSQEMLVQGRPKAFAEFFEVTADLVLDEAAVEVPNDMDFDLDAKKRYQDKVEAVKENNSVLKSLSGHLVAVELAGRSDDNMKLYSAYQGVAKLFTKSKHFEKAIRYYYKSLTSANKLNNVDYKAEAKFYLGQVYWKMQDSENSIKSFEECLAFARSIEARDRIALAARDLLDIYWVCGERAKSADKFQESIDYFKKCVKSAEACDNLRTGALAKHEIGFLYGRLFDAVNALKYQTEYLKYCANANDKVGECQAHAAIAEIHEARNEPGMAISHLEAYLVAAEAVDLRTQAKGCCLLGMLHQRHGQPDTALDYFERYFEMSRIIKDPDLLDVARVNIGIILNNPNNREEVRRIFIRLSVTEGFEDEEPLVKVNIILPIKRN